MKPYLKPAWKSVDFVPWNLQKCVRFQSAASEFFGDVTGQHGTLLISSHCPLAAPSPSLNSVKRQVSSIFRNWLPSLQMVQTVEFSCCLLLADICQKRTMKRGKTQYISYLLIIIKRYGGKKCGWQRILRLLFYFLPTWDFQFVNIGSKRPVPSVGSHWSSAAWTLIPYN